MNAQTVHNILGAVLLSTLLGVSCQPAHAAQCADNDLNCQVQHANRQWVAENGNTPRNLSAKEEAEVWQYLKQHYPNQDFNNHTLTIN